MGFLQRLFVFAVMALRGVRCFAPVPRHARHAVPRAGLDPEIEAQTKKWGLEVRRAQRHRLLKRRV